MRIDALMFGPAAALVGGATIMLWRFHETRRQVTTRSVILPPLAMSTGFLMFAVPAAHIPVSWAALALAVGALLSFPLRHTSRLERVADSVMMRRSPAFLAILLGLASLRIGLHEWINPYLSPIQTGSVFFLVAFGMIAIWRVRMLLELRRIQRSR